MSNTTITVLHCTFFQTFMSALLSTLLLGSEWIKWRLHFWRRTQLHFLPNPRIRKSWTLCSNVFLHSDKYSLSLLEKKTRFDCYPTMFFRPKVFSSSLSQIPTPVHAQARSLFWSNSDPDTLRLKNFLPFLYLTIFSPRPWSLFWCSFRFFFEIFRVSNRARNPSEQRMEKSCIFFSYLRDVDPVEGRRGVPGKDIFLTRKNCALEKG